MQTCHSTSPKQLSWPRTRTRNDQPPLLAAPPPSQTHSMIITHTINGNGHRRVYLGGKASIECWIEPAANGVGWSFHVETAPGAYPLPDVTVHQWATHVLLKLAEEVGTKPVDLRAVPFERIAALHMANMSEYRRAPVPKRQTYDHAFVASSPLVRHPDPHRSSKNWRQRD